MIRNYLKIAIRNLMKYKFISFINLFGLTTGLACCLLILTYIIHEISYDKYQPFADRTYRISRSFHNEQGVQFLHLGAIAPPFAPALRTAFPEIEKMTRLLSNGNTAFKYEDKKFYEKNVYFADENLTDVFKVDMLKGNPRTALNIPFSIMITDNIARKYFGNEDPMDKIVKLDNNFTCKIAGIFKPFPSNTHFHPDILLAFNTLKDSSVYGQKNLETNWGNNSFLTYIVLPKGYDPKRMEARFPAFLDLYMHFSGEPVGFKASKTTHLFLDPLTNIHLHSHLDYEAEENGDIKRVYIFSIIALFILLIACINYMNLSTARSILRAKEVGIRKAIGAERKEIILQFLGESILVTWAAIVLALLMTALLLPWLNSISGQELSLNIILKWRIIIIILLTPFLIGTLSGLYPAVFMSSFQPVRVLKGVFKIGGNISLRKALVILQFAISIILIISTSIVFRQLKYMQQKSLGFNKDQVITMNTAGIGNKFQSFREELLQNTNIKNVALSSRIPSGRLLDALDAAVPAGDTTQPVNADIKFLAVDYNFIPTYGIGMAAGRNYSADFPTDSSGFILNETALGALGWGIPKDALNKEFVYGGKKGKIIGVMNNFNFESLHQKIAPLIFLVMPNNFSYLSIKLSGNNIPAALSYIKSTWKKYLPETPYDYSFLDDRFGKLYESEQRQGTIFTVFAVIAIFIASLGLLGLSAFAIGQRIKEIGIRKVLGANVASLVSLLSVDFLKLIIIAAVIAFPVAWFAMHHWLQDFAYRIAIPWWVFLIAGIIAAFIAFLTISFQTIKAAMANPVKNLRTE
ncbi:MAG TPA: FtsX-like permease family protein [Flavisolibacter sp.]|jgi:putative ABC transport system permease protein|nr:FtsX-like permease family protein [Flavisolibacter sp.]